MMKGIIRAIMFAAVLQMVVGAIFTTYLFNHASAVAEQYTDTALRLQYNAVQLQFSDERSSMKDYVEKVVALRINQSRGVKQ
jgi:heme-binding NEAT domain protein